MFIGARKQAITGNRWRKRRDYFVHEICRQVEGIPCLDVVFVVQHCRRAEGVRREYLQVVLEGIEQHPNERIQVHDRVDVENDLEKQRADR